MPDWHTLRIGAGGWVTGIQIANDGTKFARTDTYGAFIMPAGGSIWQQVCTYTSMPAGKVGVQANGDLRGGQGVYEAVIAPNNSTVLYMLYLNDLYVSSNQGASWTLTTCGPFSFYPGPEQSTDPNTGSRMAGPHIAVDPINADHVYVGTNLDGLRRSVDRGVTWTTVSGITLPYSRDGMGIAFDPSSGAVGGKTQTIYVVSSGPGVYRSTNGGTSFSFMAGSPPDYVHIYCFQSGIPYITSVASSTGPYQYKAGAWSMMNSGVTNTWQCVLVDPMDLDRIIIASDAPFLNQSLDGGATWTGSYFYTFPAISGQVIAEDIPWLQACSSDTPLYTGYMTNGNMLFDPSQENVVYISAGTGVFYTSLPYDYSGYTWHSQSRGIEQLVGNAVIAPPGGQPVAVCWDRSLFYCDTLSSYKTTYFPDVTQFSAGWMADYSTTDPTFLVVLSNWSVDISGYSSDGGASWTQFTTKPPFVADGRVGGCIAAGSNTNFVWVSMLHCPVPYYTTNKGVTWAPCSFPGMPTTGETGWGNYMFLVRRTICADRVNANTFYAYNNGQESDATYAGIWRSTNSGATWTQVHAGRFTSYTTDYYHAKLRAVPGKAGHLFYSAGDVGGSITGSFYRSTDAGVTWSAVPNLLEVLCFGFGKVPTGGTYPAVYVVGWLSSVYGIWRSNDNCASWTNIGTYPQGSVDVINWIEGDKDIEGQCYIAFGGSGFGFYGDWPSWFVPV